MVLSLPNLFRAVIVVLLATHVFVMYCTARTIDETGAGFQAGTVLLAAGFALIMLLPFVWAVALPEVPEMYMRHVRARRRYERDCCPNCGYEPGQHHPDICPECGEPVREPEPYTIGWKTIRLFIAINLLAWLIGCTAAEAWVLHDQRVLTGTSPQAMLHDPHIRWHECEHEHRACASESIYLRLLIRPIT